MESLDLGSSVNYSVKFDGKEYMLAEPTVAQVQKHQDGLSDGSIEAFNALLVDIGMPQDVVLQLGISKVKTLGEFILGNLSEKK
jgi:hypothetical protein